MDQDPKIRTENAETESDGKSSPKGGDNRLVRLIKSIVVNPEKGGHIDENVVKFQYYNSFNYSLLPQGQDNVSLTLGITSAKSGEGKTLVASNLAVSLAMGSQKNTILIDLHISNPQLHDVFGVAESPGLMEALSNGEIHISKTLVDHLSILTAGKSMGRQVSFYAPRTGETMPARFVVEQSLGLDQLASFRDVIYSLEQEFEFIIVDMPSMESEEVPVLYANQLNGLVVVIQSGKTKQEDLDAMFHKVNERQVLGFVFNRFKNEQD
jgi:Mrp family chromosome partitioning ATPase